VLNKLLNEFGKGMLKRDNRLVTSETLDAGVYKYYVSFTPHGKQSIVWIGTLTSHPLSFPALFRCAGAESSSRVVLDIRG
jgi:hypothetical protein